jgi:hypothetical protein
MTDTSAAQPAPGGGFLSVGNVIKRSFSAYLANFVPFTILALILYAPSLLLTSASVSVIPGMSAEVSVGSSAETPAELALLLLSMLLTYVLVGALVFGTVQYLNDRRPGIGEIIGRGFSRIVPVIVIAILFSIAFGIGLALLVIPGVFLLVVWSVVIPASVVERPGIIGAFSRSWNLTKGHRWSVLGVLLLLLAILVGFNLLVGILMGIAAFAVDSVLLVLVLNYVLSAISGALMSVAIAVLYHDLRVAKEGVSTAQIAAVFD